MKQFKYEVVTETIQVFESLVCDRCKKLIEKEDWVEIQESFSYSFTGGYGSIFGDCCSYEIDLCQHCLKETLGEYFRNIREE